MAEGNGNGSSRGVMAYWQPIAFGAALLIQWGIQSAKIDEMREDVRHNSESIVKIGATVADNATLIRVQNDRFNAQAARLNQLDQQLATTASDLARGAQGAAMLTERIAGMAAADNPRMRTIETDIAGLKGRVDELAKSLESVRAYIIDAQRQASRSPSPTGR